MTVYVTRARYMAGGKVMERKPPEEFENVATIRFDGGFCIIEMEINKDEGDTGIPFIEIVAIPGYQIEHVAYRTP